MLLLSRFSRVRLCATPWTAWNSLGKSTGVGCHFLGTLIVTLYSSENLKVNLKLLLILK